MKVYACNFREVLCDGALTKVLNLVQREEILVIHWPESADESTMYVNCTFYFRANIRKNILNCNIYSQVTLFACYINGAVLNISETLLTTPKVKPRDRLFLI